MEFALRSRLEILLEELGLSSKGESEVEQQRRVIDLDQDLVATDLPDCAVTSYRDHASSFDSAIVDLPGIPQYARVVMVIQYN
jgi:hypothetical protein